VPGTVHDIVEALAVNPRPLARVAVRAFALTEEQHRRMRPFSPAELFPRWFDLLVAGDLAGFAESFRGMTAHMRRLQHAGPMADLADGLERELAEALAREGNGV
jgi:hypothetical protein